MQQELDQSRANMLVDIVSPLHSEQSFRKIKQREKTKRIINARHHIEYEKLMQGFKSINPAKRVRENMQLNKNTKEVLFY